MWSTCDRPRRASWDRKAMHDHAPSSNLDNMTRIFLGGGRNERGAREGTGREHAEPHRGALTGRPSELVLEGFRWESLDDGLGRLRLHHDDFAEDLTLPGLGRLLLAGLDH